MMFCMSVSHSLRVCENGVGYIDNKADATDNCRWNNSTRIICRLHGIL
jgi:hypothetical protein